MAFECVSIFDNEQEARMFMEGLPYEANAAIYRKADDETKFVVEWSDAQPL